jgi:hypothetical protein
MVAHQYGSVSKVELTWDQVVTGDYTLSPQQLFSQAVIAEAAKAKAAMPHANGRIEWARDLVLGGQVQRQPDYSFAVGSGSAKGKVYIVDRDGHCDCLDAAKIEGGRCKHLIASWIWRRARAEVKAQGSREASISTPAGMNGTATAEPPAAPEPVGQADSHMHTLPHATIAPTPALATDAPAPTIPAWALVELHGRQFVTFGGLLAMAHKRGLQSLSAHFVSVTADLALAEATATFADGRTFTEAAAAFYGVSEPTLYRLLRQRQHPRALGRADRGIPRVLPKAELERYLELIAALQVRTSNGKGRHLSTREAIRVLEDYGVDTPEGHVQAPKGLLKKPTVNAYLKAWGLDWRTVRREPPAVRFQAQYSNELWQFDLSPSDLKQLPAPTWLDASKGSPTLFLLSVVDDRSGVAYQEYHCAYGEAVEVALRFLFNAMAPKADARFPFAGRPAALYMDNGPVTRSHVFHQVMDYLGYYHRQESKPLSPVRK